MDRNSLKKYISEYSNTDIKDIVKIENGNFDTCLYNLKSSFLNKKDIEIRIIYRDGAYLSLNHIEYNSDDMFYVLCKIKEDKINNDKDRPMKDNPCKYTRYIGISRPCNK